MADWPDIQDSQCDPDAPVTSELIYGLRDGPIAIAEGAIDAPRIAKRVEVYRSTSSEIVVQRPTNYTGFLMHLQTPLDDTDTSAVSISASANGTTWTTPVTLEVGHAGPGVVAYQFANGQYKAAMRSSVLSGNIPGLPADANYFRIRVFISGTTAASTALVEFTGGVAP